MNIVRMLSNLSGAPHRCHFFFSLQRLYFPRGVITFEFNFTLHNPNLFLQNQAMLSPPPEPTDWSAVSINTDLYLGTIRSSVSSLIDKFQEELKRLYGKGEAN